MFGMAVLLLLLISTLFFSNSASAAAVLESAGEPGISDVTINDDNIPRYEKLEISFNLSGTWSNPFDPDQVAVDCTFHTPDGKTATIPGFFFQDYQRTFVNGREILNAIGEPVWKVRYSPTMPGTYRYVIRMVNAGQTVQIEERTFQCTDNSNKHGFLRVSEENPYYFRFDDGAPFLVVGENIATARRRTKVLRSADDPYSPEGGIAILRGNLAPDGAVVKAAAVAPGMLHHRGPARVFDGEEAAMEAILDGKIVAGDVVVIRYEGPRGGPGMREMLMATSVLSGMGW